MQEKELKIQNSKLLTIYIFCLTKGRLGDKEKKHYRTENRNEVYDLFDRITGSYGNKKETPPERDVSSCICLTNYRTFCGSKIIDEAQWRRTFIDSLKAFAEFIQWYKMYRL